MADEKKGSNGNKQREKIPRTTQVKRLYKHSKTTKTLKEWARESDDAVVKEWASDKGL
jgi:hypothetical protein